MGKTNEEKYNVCNTLLCIKEERGKCPTSDQKFVVGRRNFGGRKTVSEVASTNEMNSISLLHYRELDSIHNEALHPLQSITEYISGTRVAGNIHSGRMVDKLNISGLWPGVRGDALSNVQLVSC